MRFLAERTTMKIHTGMFFFYRGSCFSDSNKNLKRKVLRTPCNEFQTLNSHMYVLRLCKNSKYINETNKSKP